MASPSGEDAGFILHILTIGFHHKHGSQLEFCFPPLAPGQRPDSGYLPEEWKNLPGLALPDGAHNYEEDNVYFVLPSLTKKERSVFCVSCYRQIDSSQLITKTDDVTRSSVQKSVVVVSKVPLFGAIRERLSQAAQSYFEMRDFSRIDVLQDTFGDLRRSFSKGSVMGQMYMGLSVKDLLLLSALVATALACENPPREGAIGVAGLGYHNGTYIKLLGGIAGSKEKMKVAAYFKVMSKSYTGHHYTLFDFKAGVGYYAWGTSAANAKCVKIPVSHAKHFLTLCPKMWPNHRVVARSTVTHRKVPISVHCGHKTQGDLSVKLGGVIDDRCVPILIKKKYTKGGKCCGGILFFFGFHDPKDKYFELPELCASAKFYKPKRGEGKKPQSHKTHGMPTPDS